MSCFRIADPRPGALKFLGLPLHRVGPDQVHEFIRSVILQDARALVLNLNIHCVNLALRQSWLTDFIQKAQLVFCDGDGVRWGVRLLGNEPPPKIAFTRWIWDLCGFCAQQRYRVFFLGARPGVADQAARRLKEKYPALEVAGIQHGYFSHDGEENEKVIAQINRLRPDLLLVCFGMPLQEKWLSENWEKIDAHIFLTGGAVLDFASGTAQEPPDWMVRFHLEWFFRLCREPLRLFVRYVLGIPYFFIRVILEKFSRRSTTSTRT